MLVAAWTVHRKKGFLITSGGWEYTFVLAAAATSIAIMGPGGSAPEGPDAGERRWGKSWPVRYTAALPEKNAVDANRCFFR